MIVVDLVDLEQREITLAILGGADGAGNGIAGAQVEAAYLAGGYIDVVRAGEVGTLGGAQEVFKIKPDGTWITVKGWTESPAIVKEGWNVLKVEAEGNTFRFYINGTKVWQGSKSGLATGRVGISMYTDTSSTGNDFRVDWAKLTLAP